MEAPDNSYYNRHGHVNKAIYSRGHPQQTSSGKRQLPADVDRSQEQPLKRLNTSISDGQLDAPELRFVDTQARDTLTMTNGANGGVCSDLFDLEEVEFDNADFELNLLDTNHPPTPAKSLEAQVPGDDLWQFVTLPPSTDEKQPPSSVLGELDNVSISTTAPNFDPSLQFSPPHSASPAIEESIDCVKDVTDEISWDYVNSQLQRMCTDQKTGHTTDGVAVSSTAHQQGTQLATPPSTAPSVPAGMLLRPYKVWFHIREMLEAKESMYKNQPSLKFELFARVIHTRRENFEKKQLFQMRDLFKVNPPYLSGVLLH
ncbi:hypothetical protein V2A60_006171 [Cordyceps javanica]|uniref:Uncharacterized protein n=1 Tax=Cordyceps javanica TaxID=43265 RepID=A0A545V8W1_9HYPO|nr:hypothetical protein IF1G_03896 [Cordyceps javanica]TQW08678.1 hypothetical protein IF2G_03109 [Cordyceps javanica]